MYEKMGSFYNSIIFLMFRSILDALYIFKIRRLTKKGQEVDFTFTNPPSALLSVQASIKTMEKGVKMAKGTSKVYE